MIKICGTDFPIQTTEDDSYTLQLAEKLNKQLEDIMTATKSKNITSCLVLSSLMQFDEQQQLCHEIKNLVDMNKQLESQIIGYQTTLSGLNRELEAYHSSKSLPESTK